jgi:hypothetical protein
MRTLSVSISDIEFNRLGLQNDKLTYTDLLDIVGNEVARQNHMKSIELAEKYGLNDMTMEDINKEVRAVSDNAKNNS